MKDTSLSRKVKTILNISKCQPGNTMTRFAALFVFRVRSARKPASVVCNDDQGDLVLFCGPTREPVSATASTGKTRERFWKICG